MTLAVTVVPAHLAHRLPEKRPSRHILLGRARDVPLDDDALDDLAGNELEELEDDVVDAATAARPVAELDTEIAILTDLEPGVANISLTLSIVMFSAILQALVTRIGIRPVLPVGLALSTAALVLFAQLPVHGDYFSDLFPELLLSGVGLALAFVPMSIGALTGVPPCRRGHRLRTDQHQPADRRRDRRRARAHRRDHGHQSLRPGARRHHCVHRGRAHPRV